MGGDLERMRTVFSEQEMSRIMPIEQSDSDSPALQIDLHGLGRKAAKKFLNNIIAVCRQAHKLYVIHGYNHGTVLMELIHNNLENCKIISKKHVPSNPGASILTIAA